MPKVINLPRIAVQKWSIAPDNNTIWISISEPEDLKSVVSHPVLDQLPKLSLSFWDLTQVIIFHGQTLYPPSPAIARAIVDFLLLHRGKHVLVNCAAGVSRSGAVAQFCADFLNYEWMEEGKKNACPNHVLYNLMRDYFLSLSYEEQFGEKPLQTAYEKIFNK
jgi:predicted protein tyrosine phosphatase